MIQASIQTADREQWLEVRSHGIGSSDAAAVLGLSPWKSPLALYAEKVGLIEPDDLSDLEHVRWGNILEEPIAERYSEVTGRTVVDPGRFTVDIHPEHPFILASVDRRIAGDGNGHGPGILEIKTASAYKLQDWQEEPPLPYQVQLQHQLMVTGCRWGSLAVLVGGQKFHYVDLERNDDFCRILLDAELEFWSRVERRDPPDADGSDSTRRALEAMYPLDIGETVALSEEAWELAQELELAKQTIKAATDRKQEIENRIKAELGPFAKGLFSDGSGFTFKTQRRKAYTVEAAEFRVLRRFSK